MITNREDTITFTSETNFLDFYNELKKVPQKFHKKLFKKAFARASKLVLRTEKQKLSKYKKHTGYMKKSIKSQFKKKKWQYFSIGLKNPKPYLTRSNNRFYKGIKRSSAKTLYKARPSTYGGIWLNYGFFPGGGNTKVNGSKWLENTYNETKNEITNLVWEDAKEVIKEIKQNFNK